MQRRTVLVGVTSALAVGAGCLGRATDSESASKTSTDGDFSRTISVTAVDSVPNRYPVDLSLDVTESTVTSDRTARLAATITNTGTEAGTFDLPYYKGASSEVGDSGILLYANSAPDGPAPDESPDCIGTDGKSTDELAWTNEAVPTVSLEPNESSTTVLLVADDPTTDGCFPPGTYEFGTTFDGERSTDEWQFDWGFTLRVERTEK